MSTDPQSVQRRYNKCLDKERHYSVSRRRFGESKSNSVGKLESSFSGTVTVEAVTAVPAVDSPIAEGATSVSEPVPKQMNHY